MHFRGWNSHSKRLMKLWRKESFCQAKHRSHAAIVPTQIAAKRIISHALSAQRSVRRISMVQALGSAAMVWKRVASTFFSHLFPRRRQLKTRTIFVRVAAVFLLRGSRSCRSSCGQLRNRHAGRKQEEKELGRYARPNPGAKPWVWISKSGSTSFAGRKTSCVLLRTFKSGQRWNSCGSRGLMLKSGFHFGDCE